MKLSEIYSKEHGHLYDYLKSGEDFYPSDYSYYVLEWAEKEFGTVKNMNDELNLDYDIDYDFNDLHRSDEADEIYRSLDQSQKESCAEFCKEQIMQDENSEAPSYLHMDVKKKLPRNTWLVHFSDNAKDIWYQGFKYGTDDHERLGLTTYYKTGKGMKSGQGWNFAFIAGSNDVSRAVNGRRTKYGRDAVMFMSSGVQVYHWADEENQVIFQGKFVNPKDMVFLHNDGGTWEVIARRGNRAGNAVYRDDKFENVEKWVMKNYQQYKGIL